ncbi:glycosyltransferase [Candidatus Kaiserbacteria bacterium]|nr:glycosyltransferase [Candidatus Kaiserbacteria bacterium]
MCGAFASLGHDVQLVVPQKRIFLDTDPFAYYGVKKNFTIRTLKIPDIGSRSEVFPTLIMWLDTLAFILNLKFARIASEGDVLYFRDFPLLFAFSPRRNRLIIEVHHIYGWKRLFVRALMRASRIVAITNGLKDDLVALGLDAGKIIVAPDAVDLSMFRRVVQKDAARERLQLPPGKKIALYIGRIDAWKGTDTLFKAAELLRDVQIVAIGNGPEEISVLKKHHPQVMFVGFRPYREIADNQAAADVLVLPNSGSEEISKRYTSPLKLFTYMASRIPIVVSDLPSMREILSDEEAFFFRADDPTDLTRAIETALSDRSAGARAARAYEKVLQYSWEGRAKKILASLA